MTITIPTWLLWIIGVPLGMLCLFFFLLGVYIFCILWIDSR